MKKSDVNQIRRLQKRSEILSKLRELRGPNAGVVRSLTREKLRLLDRIKQLERKLVKREKELKYLKEIVKVNEDISV